MWAFLSQLFLTLAPFSLSQGVCGRQLFSALDPRGKEAIPTLKMIIDDSFSSRLVRAPPGLLSKHGFMDHLIGEEMDWGHPCNRESVRNVAFQASSIPEESECVFISIRLKRSQV